jgi:hypothetical protein
MAGMSRQAVTRLRVQGVAAWCVARCSAAGPPQSEATPVHARGGRFIHSHCVDTLQQIQSRGCSSAGILVAPSPAWGPRCCRTRTNLPITTTQLTAHSSQLSASNPQPSDRSHLLSVAIIRGLPANTHQPIRQAPLYPGWPCFARGPLTSSPTATHLILHQLTYPPAYQQTHPPTVSSPSCTSFGALAGGA